MRYCSLPIDNFSAACIGFHFKFFNCIQDIVNKVNKEIRYLHFKCSELKWSFKITIDESVKLFCHHHVKFHVTCN